MFSKSSVPHLESLWQSLPYSPGWTHPSQCHCHSSFASSHAHCPSWMFVSSMSGKQVSKFLQKTEIQHPWLLQTSWSRADLWCFASLFSITQWWLPAGNLWIWTSKREQEGGQVRCASSAFPWRLSRVGDLSVWLFSSLLLWWHCPMLNQTPTEVGTAKNPGSPSHKGVHGLERLKKIKDGTYFTDGDWETCLKFHRA